MSLKTRLDADMKSALRAAEKLRLSVIRMALAAIQLQEIEKRAELDEAELNRVLEKMVKQRRDSVTQFRDGGRDDLADREQLEIEVLQAYLPEPLSDTELEQLIDEAIASTGATTLKDLGKVMGRIKAQAAGRADLGVVSATLKSLLAG